MGSGKQLPEPWQRRRHESSRAYAAFAVYRDLGPERSIDKAYRVGRAETADRAPRRWFRWSQDFTWQKRAQAWDEHLAALSVTEKQEAVKREAQEWAARRRQLRDRQWRIGQALIDKAESVLKLPLVRTQLEKDGTTTIVEPVRVRLADAARLGDVASRLAGEAIEDARLEAEQSGASAQKIVNAVFLPPWLADSTAEEQAESDSPDNTSTANKPA